MEIAVLIGLLAFFGIVLLLLIICVVLYCYKERVELKQVEQPAQKMQFPLKGSTATSFLKMNLHQGYIGNKTLSP